MISVENLRIFFNGKAVIDGIDFSVSQGETLVIAGRNGAGKSVILKAIAGLNPDYSGEIKIHGRDIRETLLNTERKGRLIEDEKTVAYVFQKGGLFDSMTVYENAAFGLKRMGIDPQDINDRVISALKRVGLAGNEKKLPSELSGGMQKRVGLARAVCMNPDVILYDDPTAGLDPILSDSIADLITEIKESEKTTSIVVTHDLRVAEKIADDFLLLYNGKSVFSGRCDEFFTARNEYTEQFINGEITGPIDIF